MKLFIYRLFRGVSLILLTILMWLDLIFDEFIIEFGSQEEQKTVLRSGRIMFWEAFSNENTIWKNTEGDEND